MSADRVIVHEASRQDGVVTRAQLLAAGVPGDREPLHGRLPLSPRPHPAPEGPIREALARRLIRPEDVPGGDIKLTRSGLERRMLRLIHHVELPAPLVDHAIGPYVVDFAWPEHAVLVETDGWATHGYRAAFERDRARDAHLATLGFLVLRFTWRQITQEPARVAATIAAALSRGSRAASRSPS